MVYILVIGAMGDTVPKSVSLETEGAVAIETTPFPCMSISAIEAIPSSWLMLR